MSDDTSATVSVAGSAVPAPSIHAVGQYSLMAVAALLPYAKNARKHSKKQLNQLVQSIQAFGFTNPLLIDKENTVVAGHGRLEAAKRLGMAEVPVIRLEHLTPEQVKAYVIADNRLAELAGWDQELLRIELGDLVDVDFDVRLTGFDTAEVDVLLAPMIGDIDEPLDPDPKQPVVSRLGDLWVLGSHRLLCGDATQPESYARLLGGETIQMVFSDPPYNVPITGNVSSKDHHGEFVMASGEMTSRQFTGFLQSVFLLLSQHSVDGALHFLCMDWRHLREMMDATQLAYSELKNLCVWNKSNAGMGSLYRSKHELVFVFKVGEAPHINNVQLGKHGRNRTNVWNYAGATAIGKGRAQRLAMHPTVKPVTMIADAIKDCSHRGGLIVDPFGGSGSTLIAAEETGRRAALLELDPRYVDVIVQRHLRRGGTAMLEGDGRTWAQIKADRQPASAAAKLHDEQRGDADVR